MKKADALPEFSAFDICDAILFSAPMSRPINRLGFVARCCLLALSVSIIADLLVFFQTDYQLVSPVIPKQLVIDISRPWLLCALVTAAMSAICLGLYFYGKEKLVVVLSLLTLAGAFSYLSFIGY